MPASLRCAALVALAAVVSASWAARAAAQPLGTGAPRACAPRVIVHMPPVEVVVVEGSEGRKRLKLCEHHKKGEPAGAPGEFFVQIPAMVPAPQMLAPSAPPCAPPPAPSAPGASCAGDDVQSTIDRLKAQRARRVSEIAAIDAALSSSKPTGTGVAAAGTRNEIRDLSDKLDYLTALIDALAEDVRNSGPSRSLPNFDELNKLRKTKP